MKKKILEVVNLAIFKPDLEEILLLRREKEPFEGYWGMPGGKMKKEEIPIGTAMRELEEETGLIEYKSLCGSLNCHEIVLENRRKINEWYIHGFKFIIPIWSIIRGSTEGELRWFKITDLFDIDIIPSDPFLINLLSSKERYSAESILYREHGAYFLKSFKFELKKDEH